MMFEYLNWDLCSATEWYLLIIQWLQMFMSCSQPFDQSYYTTLISVKLHDQ